MPTKSVSNWLDEVLAATNNAIEQEIEEKVTAGYVEGLGFTTTAGLPQVIEDNATTSFVEDLGFTQTVNLPAVVNGGAYPLTAFNAGAGVGNEASDTAALNSALASGEKQIILDAVQFEIEAGTYAIPAGMSITGLGKGSVLYCADTALNVALLRVASNVRLSEFVMRGPQNTVSTYVAGQHGIDTGDTGSDIENVRLSDLEIYGFAAYGVTGHRMKNLRSRNNLIRNVGRAGFLMVGGEDCVHVGDRVVTVGPGSGGVSPFINAYGFQYGNDGATAGFPRPKNITFIGCGVRDIPVWTGFDSHGVDGMHLIDCWTYQVCNPIYLGPSSGTNTDACTNSSVIGGRFEAGGLTYTRAGLILSKATGDLGGDGTRIVGPLFDGHGINAATYATGNYTDEGCIHVVYSKGVTITDPVIRNWHQSAINFRREVESTSLRGHNIGNGNSVNSIMQAIRVVEAQNTDVLIERGTVKRTSGAMVGLHVGGTTPSGIYGPKVMKQDMIGVPTPMSSGSFALMHQDSTFELTGTSTQDMGSIAPGSGSAITITVTGASVGDKVARCFHTLSDNLVFRDASVTSSNTVTVTVYNPTSAAIDPASATYTAVVSKMGGPADPRTDLELVCGTWTPTLTSVANVAASTAFVSYYTRMGNRVRCWGQVNIQPTAAANTATHLGISLPIATTFASSTNCVGTCSANVAQRGGRCDADTANARVRLLFASEVTTNTSFAFSFEYILA